MFGQVFYEQLAAVLKDVYPDFKADAFKAEMLTAIPALELNARMRHTSLTLRQYLPENYKKTIPILKKAILPLKQGYTTLIFPDFVGQFGTHDCDTSLEALKFFTRFGSSEFAIRVFLKQDFDRTLNEMEKWSLDSNEHVRRLASEGSRPRLPWSFKLDAVIQNPALTKPILENLKQDEALYVRKSVANHLNDVSKDSPAYVQKLVGEWNISHPHTAWIVKRGCRSLLKQGDKKSLAAFKFTKDVAITIRDFKLTPATVRIGEAITFQFDLVSTKKSIQKLMVDYRIYYVKKSGGLMPKVFKLKECVLKPGETLSIKKKQSFKDFTTRKHLPGKHKLELLVNGEVMQRASFMVA